MSGTYVLKGISNGAGQCSCCGRNLKRLFRIAGPNGEGVYGTVCARKLTGWTPDLAQALFLEAQAAREAELDTEGLGDLYREARRLAAVEAARFGTSTFGGNAFVALRGEWASVKLRWYNIDVDYAREMLAEGLRREAAGAYVV